MALSSGLASERKRIIKTVFVTGASGYVGGSVSERLRDAGYTVLGLVRSPEKAELLKQRGIEPVLGDLEDTKVLEAAAARADAVINAADSDRKVVIETLLKMLEKTGKTFIHTSGSSVICDDACGEYASTKIHTEDTYFDPLPSKALRASLDKGIREAGINRGIRTIVICPTMIYGIGRGINKDSGQVTNLQAMTKARGVGLHVGKGANIWSNVFIDDVVHLFLLALEKAPSGSFFFAENGESTLKEVAEVASRSLGFGGKTETWIAEEAFKTHGGFARYALASNSRVRSVNARATLQWNPTGPTLAEAVEKRL